MDICRCQCYLIKRYELMNGWRSLRNLKATQCFLASTASAVSMSGGRSPLKMLGKSHEIALSVKILKIIGFLMEGSRLTWLRCVLRIFF